MRRLALLGCVLALGACGTLKTPHATLEIAETDAETAYQATLAALDAAEGAGKITPAVHDADKLKAWDDLQAVRVAYNAGQSLTATYAVLLADKTAAGAQ